MCRLRMDSFERLGVSGCAGRHNRRTATAARRWLTRLARAVSRAGRAIDRRGGRQHVRVASARRAHRHNRQSPERQQRTRPRNRVGRLRNEARRPGERALRTGRWCPKWIRGSESAEIVEPARHQIVMLGLGDSVGTPPDGVQAEVFVVQSFEELDAHAARARGKIVLFNVPFTIVRRDGAFPRPGAVARRACRRGCRVGARRRSSRPAHAAYRCAAVRR